MKNFIEWAKEHGLYDEIAFTAQGKKDYELQQAMKKREKKGAGREECPVCEKSPCACKTAKLRNRIKR